MDNNLPPSANSDSDKEVFTSGDTQDTESSNQPSSLDSQPQTSPNFSAADVSTPSSEVFNESSSPSQMESSLSEEVPSQGGSFPPINNSTQATDIYGPSNSSTVGESFVGNMDDNSSSAVGNTSSNDTFKPHWNFASLIFNWVYLGAFNWKAGIVGFILSILYFFAVYLIMIILDFISISTKVSAIGVIGIILVFVGYVLFFGFWALRGEKLAYKYGGFTDEEKFRTEQKYLVKLGNLYAIIVAILAVISLIIFIILFAVGMSFGSYLAKHTTINSSNTGSPGSFSSKTNLNLNTPGSVPSVPNNTYNSTGY